MLVERSSKSTGSFLRLAETAGRISLRGVRFGPPVSAVASLTIGPFPVWMSACTQDVLQHDPRQIPERVAVLAVNRPGRSYRCFVIAPVCRSSSGFFRDA
jgi:hypothetical protein